MNNVIEFVLNGGNRGGNALFAAARSLPVRRVLTVDPKPGRALSLADRWRQRGAEADAIEDTAQSALGRLPDRMPTVLAVDDPGAIATVVRERDASVYTQAVLRGATLGRDDRLQPPAVGMAIATHPSRGAERAEVQGFLDRLADWAPPQSSAEFRAAGTQAMRLKAARMRTSRWSVERLARKTAPDDDILAELQLGDLERFPLIVRKSERAGLLAARDQALDASSADASAVAVMGNSRIDVFLVRRYRRHDGTYVTLHLAIEAPQRPIAPAPRPEPQPEVVIDAEFADVFDTPAAVSLPIIEEPRRLSAWSPEPRRPLSSPRPDWARQSARLAGITD